MHVADDPELAGWLSPDEARAFCDRLGVRCERADLPTLRALVRAYLGRVPFQNVSMLARYGRVPTRDELLADMRRGRGGPCNVMNPFLATVLSSLGYRVALLSGSMAQPDCHIALSVEVEDRLFWVDVGNGHPYLEPVAFGDEAVRRWAGLAFRLVRREDGAYAVEHRSQAATSWRASYVVRTEPRPFRFFASMIEQHHTRTGYGPFMTGLRIIRFPDGARTAIRDDVLSTGRTTIHKQRLDDREALTRAMAMHFADIDLPLDDALRMLARAGRPMFLASSPSAGGEA
ncbi:arylamine N-acetyltransferase family protein [Haliangium ochraceum]|uniref:N-acetyltransferase n=1 Tax=Haliangium ochraceum (strain DSM 14365 / JCM 11303 / SMP-2) TaxID=502025 RepID=D0LPF6_HALO1|nr:arylamine N-acetyltransferase [Haliangium ochraceum]ACY13521.1 N-acetyltransferase [Haliangium ochraceum DSM 14365]